MGTVIKSAVAGPNISKNGQPVRFHVNLAGSAKVELYIFTPAGALVYGTTFNGNTGANSTLWNVQNSTKGNVSSGLYLYVIRATSGSNVEVKTGKVVILR